jgi:thiol-disulfide isomerase/thioredoxin
MYKFSRKNLNRHTRKNNSTNGIITIGLIYANWCGHCQALKPEWRKMKSNIMKTPSYKRGVYKFVEIEDADQAKDQKINSINSRLTGEKLAANGYPTVFKIHGGKLHYFQGDRTANSLQSWFSTKTKVKSERSQTPFLNRIFGGKTRKNKL